MVFYIFKEIGKGWKLMKMHMYSVDSGKKEGLYEDCIAAGIGMFECAFWPL